MAISPAPDEGEEEESCARPAAPGAATNGEIGGDGSVPSSVAPSLSSVAPDDPGEAPTGSNAAPTAVSATGSFSSAAQAAPSKAPTGSSAAPAPARQAAPLANGAARPAERFCRHCGAERGQGLTICGSCGELLGDDPLLGKIIDDRYEVVRRLGAGGMGAVYEVRHLRLGKRFAMKVIHPELTRIPQFIARFEREALSTSRLDHPSCISVTDFGHAASGELYLVMEFVEGQPLSELMLTPLPVRRALEITRQVLLGLQHAHASGVVHRDIKPENVMRVESSDGGWRVKLLDFGLAKLPVGSPGESLTQAGIVMGTPQYMAPEQILSTDVDARADLYSTGVMLFRMLTGRRLFEIDEPMELLTTKLSTPAPTLNKVAPGLFSPALQELLERALQQRPSERFASAAEMLQAIERVQRQPGGGLALSSGGPLAAIGTRARWAGTVLWRSAADWYYEPDTGISAGEAWFRRLKRLVTTRRGAVVLGAALAPLALLALLALMLGGDSASRAQKEVPPHIAAWTPLEGGDRGRVKVAGSVSVAPGSPSKVTPRVRGEQLPAQTRAELERVEKLLEEGSCAQAESTLRGLLVDHPQLARAHHLLGGALLCRRQYSDGLSAYAEALKLDRRLRSDPRLLADAERLLRNPKIAWAVLDFLNVHVGDAAVDLLVEAASRNRIRHVRWRAAKLVDQLGQAERVDWVTALALDLGQLPSCKERAEVVTRLVALKDRRAIAVLRKARDERSGIFGHRHRNACIRKQLNQAISELQSLPQK